MTMFRNFPFVDYTFGNENFTSRFQNITAYIDLIDQVADEVSFYEKIEIPDGYRADTLSQELYGSTDYYWMFFLLNEKLRIQGWPLASQDVYNKSKLFYPHTVLLSTSPFYNEFFVGDIVATQPFSNPSFKARIIEKNYDLGQIIVEPIKEVRVINITNGGSGYTSPPTVTISGGGGTGTTAQAIMTYVHPTTSAVVTTDIIQSISIITPGKGYTAAPTITISAPNVKNGTQATATAVLSTNNLPNNTGVYSQPSEPDTTQWDLDLVNYLFVNSTVAQWNSPHHYEDNNGDWYDLTIRSDGGIENRLPGANAITYEERLILQNEALKQIKVFKPNVVTQIDAEFQKLLRQ